MHPATAPVVAQRHHAGKAIPFKERTMKYPAFIRSTDLLLAGAACAGAVMAQQGKITMKDIEPLPPEDRSSIGAIVLTTEPVLAQKEQASSTAQTRSPTSMMGAGPAVVERKQRTKAELEAERAKEAADLHHRGAGSLIEK
jgi:hypothetical protein